MLVITVAPPYIQTPPFPVHFRGEHICFACVKLWRPSQLHTLLVAPHWSRQRDGGGPLLNEVRVLARAVAIPSAGYFVIAPSDIFIGHHHVDSIVVATHLVHPHRLVDHDPLPKHQKMVRALSLSVLVLYFRDGVSRLERRVVNFVEFPAAIAWGTVCHRYKTFASQRVGTLGAFRHVVTGAHF